MLIEGFSQHKIAYVTWTYWEGLIFASEDEG